MQNFDFNLHFIVPVSSKIIPLNVLYGQQILCEDFIMPWETGIVKQITFSTLLNTDFFDSTKLKIINSNNKMPVDLQSLELNNQIQDIPTFSINTHKKIYLDTFLRACDFEATILKLVNLPSTVSVSHSYLCNGNLYVPNCDRQNCVISFDEEETPKLEFVIEFFETDMTDCLCYVGCNYDNGLITTSIKHHYQYNINQLHQTLKNHYEEICNEEFLDDVPTLRHSSTLLNFPTIENSISLQDAYAQDISAYSVIKIEGLPREIDIQKYDIFHQNGCYYLSDNNKKAYHYLLSQASQANNQTDIIISYYNHNTLEPVLQNKLLLTPQNNRRQQTG